jgi:CMP-2-keto-3-deoxyoctulosonic acid synthetase
MGHHVVIPRQICPHPTSKSNSAFLFVRHAGIFRWPRDAVMRYIMQATGALADTAAATF